MSDVLDPAPRIPRLWAYGIILAISLVLFNIISLCFPRLLAWRQPLGVTLDIIGAVLLAFPDVPLFWHRLYGGRLDSGVERLNDMYDIPGFLLSPRYDDPDSVGYEIYTYGFDEVLDALKRAFSRKEAKNTKTPDIEWGEIDQISFETKKVQRGNQTIQEERLFLDDHSQKDPIGDFNADWIRWHLDKEVEIQEHRVRRLGIGLLIIGFIQLLILSIPSIGVASQIYKICELLSACW